MRDTCVGAANCTPKTLAVDVAPDGSAPNGKAGRQLAISGDGRFVAFVSRATNLVPGNAVVSLGYWELYVRDLCVGANAPSGCTPHTEIISLGADGEAASGPSTNPSLSADGRFIAFVSAATNLVAEKPSSLPQAYVRDTCAGPTATKACVARTVAVPVDDEDRVAGAQAGRPAISSDGRYVALEMWTTKSAAQNSASTSQIVLADTCMGIEPPVYCEASAERISYAPDDSALSGANISPSLSSDARFVVFESQPVGSSTGNTAQLSKSYPARYLPGFHRAGRLRAIHNSDHKRQCDCRVEDAEFFARNQRLRKIHLIRLGRRRSHRYRRPGRHRRFTRRPRYLLQRRASVHAAYLCRFRGDSGFLGYARLARRLQPEQVCTVGSGPLHRRTAQR